MEPNRPDSHESETSKPPPSPSPEIPKPIFTKALGSMICGFLSLPTCFCFGVPSILLGGLAIYLGLYVKKNFRGNTASEVANLYAWIGIITGGLGVLLGVVGLIILLFFGGFGVLLETAG